MLLRRAQNAFFSSFSRLPAQPRMRILSGGCGLFGDVFMALNGLRFAEQRSLPCCVDWDARSLYFDAPRGANAWEYFFQRSCFGPQTRIRASLPYRPGADDFEPYKGLSVRRSVHAALERYALPRQEILDDVDAFIAGHFPPADVIGVHVRLTDAARGLEQRKVVSPARFIEEATAEIERRPGANIFLAADDERVVSLFSECFGDRLIVQACTRSTDGVSLHGHYDKGSDVRPYLKGREVMIDALLLARCTHLIRSHSRVTCYSLCVNPSLTYTDLDQMHLGVNRTPWLHETAAGSDGPAS
jgi:hypothetical protein